MAWVGANDVHASFTANDFTVFADPFYACADFHRSCSQNSSFIKARQYRNESHIPTRAISQRNAFFPMEPLEMERNLPASNRQAANIRGARPNLGPETLLPAANPIHRLSSFVALTPVYPQAQFGGKLPIFHPFEASRWNRRLTLLSNGRRHFDQIPLAGKTDQVWGDEILYRGETNKVR